MSVGQRKRQASTDRPKRGSYPKVDGARRNLSVAARLGRAGVISSTPPTRFYGRKKIVYAHTGSERAALLCLAKATATS
jgi:hypothetical protein